MNKNYAYCACIRTLGKAGEKYLRTLQSLQQQTIKPKRIIVYIAQGYDLPKERIGSEEFVPVKKGFIAQRALPYTEVDTPFVLLLDDDVAFPSDMVEKLFNEMEENHGDCIVADVYKKSKRSLARKLISAWSFSFPMRSDRWAVRIRRSGAFSYNNHPTKQVYESQSGAGACSLWKKEALKRLHFEDEIYFDRFHYCIGDDQLMFYKAYRNGLRVLCSLDSNIQHLDAKSGHSQSHRQQYLDSGAVTFLIWHRTCYLTASNNDKWKCVLGYFIRVLFLTSLNIAISFKYREPCFLYYLQGIRIGMNLRKKCNYKSLPPYFRLQ